ncbi:DUF3325 family protein [Bordetella petrii]|uniref:DUF3325 family protein n=1 Tax=Bordetella petrii TaxID=94624 RepID=UPI003AF39CBB
MWISLALAFPAFAALALAMPRHQEEILGRELDARARHGWRARICHGPAGPVCPAGR